MTLVVGMRVTADTATAVTDLDKVTAAERRIGSAAKVAGQDMAAGFQMGRTSAQNLIGTVTDLKDGLFRATAAFGVTAVITQFTRGIVDSSNKMIGWRQSFNAATGSMIEGATSLEYARSEADRLGLSLESSTYSFAKLTAATRGTILAGQQTRDIFTSISEASRVLNLGAEQTTGALRAVEQMISKGNVQAEELRGQLAERIPGAFQLAASAMKVTTAELSGMLERGEVLASDMLPKLAEKLKEFYGSAAVDASKTPSAELARLQNAILELQVAIGNAGFMQTLEQGAKELTQALTSLAKSGSLDVIVTLLGDLALLAVAVFSSKVLNAVGAYTKGIYEATLATTVLADTEMGLAKSTLAAADAEVVYHQARLASIETDRIKTAQGMAQVQANIANANSMLSMNKATKDLGALSGMITARKAALDALATAEARMLLLNADATSLAKARAIQEGLLAQAIAAHAAAEAALVAPLSANAVLMGRVATAAKGLFAALGGWTTVALAGVYVLYQLIDAEIEYEKSLRAPFPALDELTDKMREQIRLQNLINAGRATAANVDVVTEYEKQTTQLASFNEQLQVAQKQLAGLGQGGDRLTMSLRSGLLQTVEDLKLKIMSGQESIGQFVLATVALGRDVPPQFQGIVDKINETTESLRRMYGQMSNAPAQVDAMTQAEQKFNETLNEKIGKLGLVRVEQEKGLKAALVYEAAEKRATELKISHKEAEDSLSASTLTLIDNVVKLTNQNKMHEQAEQAAESAMSKKESMLRKTNEAIEQQRNAYDKLLSISAGISSDLDGEFAKAENDHAERLNEINSLVQTMIEKKTQLNDTGLTWTDIILAESKAITAANRELETNNRLAKVADTVRKAAGSVVSRGLKDLKDQVTNLKLSNSQLAIHEALLVASKEAQDDFADGKRESIELTLGEIEAIKNGADALLEARDAAELVKEETEELDRALSGLKDIGLSPLLKDIDLLRAAIEKGFDPKIIEQFSAKIQVDTLAGFEALLGAVQTFSKEGSSSFAKIQTGMAALSIVQDLIAMKAAVTAVLTQGQGEPYSAFARMAAMAAAVAPFIASIGGTLASLGGGSSGPQTSEIRQESQGTGTILGDSEAKSESILNASEITADATSQLVGINRGMLTALMQLNNSIGSATGMLARGAGDVEFTPVVVSQFQHAFLGSFFTPMLRLLGGSSRITDQGIAFSGGINDIGAQAYQETQSRSWRFGRTRTREQTADLPDNVAGQFQLIMDSIVDTVREGALALGLLPAEIEEAMAAFRIEEVRISLKDLSAEEQQEELQAVFSSIFDGLAGDVVPFIEQFQRVGEGLGETLVRVATGVQVTQEALTRLGFSLDETSPEAFAQISEALIEMTGGLEEFINGMGSFVDNFAPEAYKFELLQNDLTRALTQVGLAVPATREAMWTLMQSLDATTESGREQIAALLRLSGIADQYYSELEDNIDSVGNAAQQAAMDVALFSQSIADSIIGQEGTQFENAMLRITRSTTSYISDANALARSQGQAGASTRDLALIHRWAANEIKKAIRELEDAARSLIDELGYGALATLEQQIAIMEATQQAAVDGANSVAEAAEDLFGQWEDGIRSLGEYIDSLLVSDLSPLSPEDQFLEAQRQLNDALAAAQGGDINALNSLPQLADQFLQMLRDREASGVDYSDPANALIAQLQALGVNPYSPIDPGAGPVELVPSEALLELYAQRDQLMVDEDLARRLALAQELAGYITELARATGESIFEVADRLGLNFAAFITDLGGVITAETAAQVTTLAEVANVLGVELPDLAERLGLALGELTDAQSLINDSFELQLGLMPIHIRDLLQPLLEDVENAANPLSTNEALSALELATNNLPEEYRRLLAPYLEGIDLELPDILNELDFLSNVDANTLQANQLLYDIWQTLLYRPETPSNPVDPTPPVDPRSISGGEAVAFVRGDGAFANMQSFEANQSAVVYEMQETRALLAQMAEDQRRRDEARDRENKSAIEANAGKVANAVESLKSSSTDRYRN